MTDKDITVIKSGSGGAGWFLVGALLVIVAIGGYVVYGGGLSGGDTDISIDFNLPAAK